MLLDKNLRNTDRSGIEERNVRHVPKTLRTRVPPPENSVRTLFAVNDSGGENPCRDSAIMAAVFRGCDVPTVVSEQPVTRLSRVEHFQRILDSGESSYGEVQLFGQALSQNTRT